MTAQTVIRQWQPNRNRVAVSTRHPEFGALYRGTIRAVPSDGWRGAWEVADCDAALVGDGPVVGDYLDAEQVLLAATSALDA